MKLIDDKDVKENMVYLKLPYISEAISSQVVKFVRKHKLPVKVIFTPACQGPTTSKHVGGRTV